MTIFGILASSVFTPAVPVEGVAWVSNYDFPDDVMRAGTEASVGVRLTIDPNGRVESCDVVAPDNSARLNAVTCRLIRQRARFEPAKNLAGKPVYGLSQVYVVNWRFPENGKFTRKIVSDIAIRVNRLPESFPGDGSISVALLTSASGQLNGCEIARGETFPQLARLACREATAKFTPKPLTNSAGEAVEAVRSITVRFEVQ